MLKTGLFNSLTELGLGSMCRHAYKIFSIIFRIYFPILLLNKHINHTKTIYFAKFSMLSLTHGAKYSEHCYERGIQWGYYVLRTTRSTNYLRE